MQKAPSPVPPPAKTSTGGEGTRKEFRKDERFFCIVDVSRFVSRSILPFFHIRETCGQGFDKGESLGKRGDGVWGRGEKPFFRKVSPPFPNLHTKQSNAN